jgi:methyl-accepting chemotaxis protein
MEMPKPVSKIIYLQKMFADLNQQLMLLSQMNEKAIELKTNDAKVSAKKALGLMTIVGSFCFLIALTFTYNFASYFSGRFFQLHNGIKELGLSNYGQRLHFEGKDEFYEIALVFNEMAEKLHENLQIKPVIDKKDIVKEINLNDIEELKRILAQIKIIEKQAGDLITKFKTLKG